jgi:hypothetical protein
MKNGDLPAMPVDTAQLYESRCDKGTWEFAALGLTKREMFCLHNDVAETGDAELDEIIKKGNKQKLAMAAMQGILANSSNGMSYAARDAVLMADELLAKLDKTK